MRTPIALILLLAALLALGACGDDATTTDPTGSTDTGGTGTTPVDTAEVSVDLDAALAANGDAPDDPGDGWRSEARTVVVFDGADAAFDDADVTWADGVLTIGAPGVYELSGTLDDGRIVVDTDDDGLVVLVLAGLDAASSLNAPLAVMSAELTLIHLADGTVNTLSDPAVYTYDDPSDDEPNACLFSKDDLVIDGDGALTIHAAANDGLASKDGLLILGGDLLVDAADDGLRGKDCLVVRAGDITVTAGGDGLKSDEDEDAGLGYILLAGGTLAVEAGADGLQAETDVLVAGGSLILTCGGGHDASLGADDSAKGLKAGVLVLVTDGDLQIDAADDAVHSDNAVILGGGTLVLQTGDDGVHGEVSLEVGGGSITVSDSYEGLEAPTLTINGGVIDVTSSDDGLNAAGGSTNTMVINGGFIFVDATGDGLDCNGSVTMNGGTLLISGPSRDDNGALDSDGTFRMNGGFLAAVGSSRMAQTVSSSSSQNGLLATFSSRSAGTLVRVETADGVGLCTFMGTRSFASLAFSSPDLVDGSGYRLLVGGTCTGTSTHGLYTGGTYSGGTLLSTFAVSARVTSVR